MSKFRFSTILLPPFPFIALLYSAYLLFSKFNKLWRIAMIVGLLVFLGIGTKGALSYKYNLDNFREYQRNAVVVDWLYARGKSGPCVVIVKEAEKLYRKGGNNIVENLNLLIPAATSCDVYFGSYTFFNMPAERNFHNYLAYLRLNGVTEKNIEQFFEVGRTQIITFFYDNWAEMFYPGRNEPWLLGVSDMPKIEKKGDELIEKIRTVYPAFMRQDFGLFLKQYRVDYLVYDKKYGGEWNEKWSKFLHKEAELGDFVIYSFK